MSVEAIYQIPISTIIIMLLSLGLGGLNTFLYRRMVDVNKLREVREKMNDLRRQIWEARKKGDKHAFAKLQRRQTQLLRESSKVLGQQSKLTLVTAVPLLLLFMFLNGLPWGAVAYAPFAFPWGAMGSPAVEIPFWLWYFLSAMAVNLPLNRKFRMYG